MSVASRQSVSITLPAELTAASRECYEFSLSRALSEHPVSLHLDCSMASLIVSSHIELLWHTKTQCENSGARLDLDNPSIGLLRVLTLLDLADHFITNAIGTEESGADGSKISRLTGTYYEDQFDATLEAVTAATWKFKAHLESLPLADLFRFELATVFYEVANNIREHGTPPEDSAIHCTARWEGKEIVLEFSDFGKAYDPSRPELVNNGRQTAHRAPRGYGLALIQRLSDKMTYRRTTDGQNILTLRKRWEAAR